MLLSDLRLFLEPDRYWMKDTGLASGSIQPPPPSAAAAHSRPIAQFFGLNDQSTHEDQSIKRGREEFLNLHRCPVPSTERVTGHTFPPVRARSHAGLMQVGCIGVARQ